MKKSCLHGVFAPIVTVFDENGRIQMDRIEKNILRYNRTELSGYMPLGSNGEFQGLLEWESLELLERVCRCRAAGKLVFGGCGRETPEKTLDFIEKAARCGLDYAFILPPHYFTALIVEEGLFRFYQAVADRSPLPIVLYNAPKFAAGLELTPEFVARLAAHPNIAALKNSSATPDAAYLAASGAASLTVVSGSIKTFYTGLESGAAGGVLSTATYLPEECCRLYRLFTQGETSAAAALSADLIRLSEQTVGPLGVAGVKCALELRALHGGHVRLPLLDVSPAERDRIRQVFSALGIHPLQP